MRAKSIMVVGTMSSAGKSVVTAGLCRMFHQDGYRVAPFKSQNMALNSYITKDGLEMGRAQVMQAEAAGIAPDIRMNPILLKPTSEAGSQVIVNGKVYDNLRAKEYYQRKQELIPEIRTAYESLAEEYDIVVLEGAGSPAEINLRDVDIVNMGMAKMADAPVLLVGDIDRGGVFAQLYGTVMLLDDEEKSRIKGTIINKFRGDVEILRPGLDMIENLTNVPVVGVVPYGYFMIDDEDSLSERFENKTVNVIDIAVVRFPRISNFTDFNVFECIDGVSVRYVNNVSEIGNPDMIILPGSKNTVADLLWMRKNGIEAAVKKSKCPIFGICGGYQMLGEKITDTDGVENGGSVRGMGLLPMETEFKTEKTRTIVNGVFENMTGTLKSLNGTEFEGYEIHMGKSEFSVPYMTKLSNGKQDGISQGDVYGSYVHGIFDKCADKIVKCLCDKKGIDSTKIKSIDMAEMKEREYDRLADTVRESLDMDLIYKIINKEV